MVELILQEARAQEPVQVAPYHAWTYPDDSDWAQFFRMPGGFLVRFPELADFSISSDGRRVTAWAVPGVDEVTTEHLYLNQVLPLALGKLGRHVFHASAVDIGGGAIAFLAESGRGKSTLAASFAIRGQRFLTDDGLIIERSERGFSVVPSHPSLRLWDDSHEVLLGADIERAPAVSYTQKARFMAGSQLTHCDEARPLVAAYLLGDGSAPQVTIEPLAAADALIEWTSHSFLLDIEDRQSISEQFYEIASLVNAVPTFRLDYPRQYDRLPQLIASIANHARQRGARYE